MLIDSDCSLVLNCESVLSVNLLFDYYFVVAVALSVEVVPGPRKSGKVKRRNNRRCNSFGAFPWPRKCNRKSRGIIIGGAIVWRQCPCLGKTSQ